MSGINVDALRTIGQPAPQVTEGDLLEDGGGGFASLRQTALLLLDVIEDTDGRVAMLDGDSDPDGSIRGYWGQFFLNTATGNLYINWSADGFGTDWFLVASI